MDPLAQLKDIHLPANIHNYPIAPGWWLLAALTLILIIFIILKLRKHQLKNRAKKHALKQAEQAQNAESLVSILKWSSLQYFPREQVAHLTGEHFKRFLTNALPEKQRTIFSEKVSESLSHVYHPKTKENVNEDIFINFKDATTLWLQNALPPKTLREKSDNINEEKS